MAIDTPGLTEDQVKWLKWGKEFPAENLLEWVRRHDPSAPEFRKYVPFGIQRLLSCLDDFGVNFPATIDSRSDTLAPRRTALALLLALVE